MDRAGLRPIDYQEFRDEERMFASRQPGLNAKDYSDEELELIGQALRIIVDCNAEKRTTCTLSVGFGDPNGTGEA